MVFLLIICMVFTLVYSTCVLWHFFKKREFDGLLVVGGIYDLVFGIFPTLISWQIVFHGSQSEYIKSVLDFSNDGIRALVFFHILAFIGFAGIWFSYYGRNERSVARRNNRHRLDAIRSIDARMPIVAWICLVIGAVSLVLWAKAYGSIFVLIEKANMVRSGYGGVVNKLAFFKRPASVVLFCTLMFYTLVLNGKDGKGITATKCLNVLGLGLSMGLSYLYLMANDGRLVILTFLLQLVWLTVAGRKIKSVLKTTLLGGGLLIAGILLISQMDSITHFIRVGTWEKSESSVFAAMVRELIFLPRGGQTCIMAVWDKKIGLTIIDDLVTGVFAWVPSGLKPSGFQDVWNTNTLLIFGNLDVTHGQQPCSIINQGYYDLRFVGVIVFSVLLGKCTKMVDKWDMKDGLLILRPIKAFSLEMLFRCVAYCSLYDIILGLFSLAVVLIVYACTEYAGRVFTKKIEPIYKKLKNFFHRRTR